MEHSFDILGTIIQDLKIQDIEILCLKNYEFPNSQDF